MADRFDVGDVAELRTPFYTGEEPNRVLTDPGTVTMAVVKPDGSTISPAVVRESLGIYVATFPVDQAGVWGWTITGTAPAAGSEFGVLEVFGRLTRDQAFLEAYARLRSLTESALDPTLSPEELEDLLRAQRRADSEGRAPGDEGWASTFHVNAAAAAGWRLKAGKLAARATDITADDGGVKRSQGYQHCLEMARLYSRGGLAVAHLTTTAKDIGADRAVVNLSEARLEELNPGASAGGPPV